MRLSDESTEKFEIELANEQVKKIKQAINDCQLRFGKVMGCGTCKALQLCTWVKELSSTIESMGKYIEAQQQEIDRLREKVSDLTYTLTGVMHFVDKWFDEIPDDMDEVNRAAQAREIALQAIEALTAEKDELVMVLKQAKYLLRRYGDYIKSYPCNCKFALGFDGHKTPYRDGEMCERCTELAEIDKVIGGKEDA